MKITITKKNGRSQLFCTRVDGTTTHSNVGPTVPFHDIAHFVCEKHLDLQEGFFGNIAKGYSIEELSDKEIIKTLGPESWVAEIITRALQSLSSGACDVQDFGTIIRQELDHLGIKFSNIPDINAAKRMMSSYMKFVEEWNSIPEGKKLEMEFRER